MKKKLFQEAFKKAENQCGNNTKHGLSSHLERVFSDDFKFSVNKITFIRYYEKYIENSNNNSNNPSSDLLNKISEYLGYNNYEDYVNNRADPIGTQFEIPLDSNKNKPFINFIKDNRIAIIIILFLTVGFITFHYVNRQRWMIWEKDQYIEVAFNTEKYDLGQLKLLNEERLNDFKKIQTNCATIFFNENGSAKIWYGKNIKKELEYFTSYGLHPETGKELDPITEYMIKKYICEVY